MDHNSVFDALLVEGIQNGDKKAAELLVKRWHKRLVSFSHKLVHNVATAEDIVQDSWVIILKNSGKLKDKRKFKTWAFRIIHNRSIDWMRKEQRNHDVESAAQYSTLGKDPEDKTEALFKVLKQLKDKDRIILSLFYLEGNNIYEIAEILDVPVGTIKSRIFYAREHLKKKYKEVYHE